MLVYIQYILWLWIGQAPLKIKIINYKIEFSLLNCYDAFLFVYFSLDMIGNGKYYRLAKSAFPTRSIAPTTSALPIKKARLPSDTPSSCV